MIANLDLKTILRDKLFIALFINGLLVILGYAAISLLGSGVFQFFKIFRVGFLFLCLIWTIKVNGFKIKAVFRHYRINILIFLTFFFSIINFNFLANFYTIATFLIGLFYIVFTINYLSKYDKKVVLVAFSIVSCIIFSVVVLSFFAFGGNLSNTNIYRTSESLTFVSNHYGWSSCLVILSGYDIIRHVKMKKITFYGLILLVIFAVYLLLISGSRSGLLSFGLTLMFVFIKNKRIQFYKKVLIALIPILLGIYLAGKENSALKFIKEKSEQQLNSNLDARFQASSIMFDVFEDVPHYWISGIGMFEYKFLKSGDAILNKYHNSYFEILFGGGLITFLLFLNIMVYIPLKVFWKWTHEYSLLLFPLMIIPFFESDLTAGQFLYFPWFSYMLLLNSKQIVKH